MTSYDPNSLFGHGIKLEELKKQIKDLKNKIGETATASGHNHRVMKEMTFPRFLKIEQTLQELNQIVKGITFDLNTKGYIDAYTYHHYRERLQENEEKIKEKEKE